MGGKAAIILVMGFGVILGYISLNLNDISLSAVSKMARYNDATASHNLATIGANVGLATFYSDTSRFANITQTFERGPLRGSFSIQMTDVPGNQIRLRSISRYPMSVRSPFGPSVLYDTVEVFFDKERSNSFSLFAWMTNIEGGVLWGSFDTVWGRIHSNDNISISGSPTFMQKVTTAKNFNPRVGRNPNRADFRQGYEVGVAKVDLPPNISEFTNAANSGGKIYSSDIWVTLSPGTSANNDGMVYVRNTKTGPIVDSIDLRDPSFNGALLGRSRVNVSGTLDGKLSIGSLTDVYIQDDIYYAQHPRTVGGDDMLGIISNNNVVIANVPETQNCVIHGSIFTRGSLTVEDVNTRPNAGQLTVIGSIVQNQRGVVRRALPGGLFSGFGKSYYYDERLADRSIRPPFYPSFYARTYAIKNWWESYRVIDFAAD